MKPADPPPQTPDRRYVVVRGRLWRAARPDLPETERRRLVAELMSARREVRAAAADPSALRDARARVDAAKRALGERGPPWWDDGAPDFNRRLARNTPYAAWFEANCRPSADPAFGEPRSEPRRSSANRPARPDVNTANLQLEGFYIAVASLMAALRRHEVLSESAIDAALAEAERCAEADAALSAERSQSNVQATLFPIRLLRLANAYGTSNLPPFSELASRVGVHNHEARTAEDGEPNDGED